MVQSAGQHNNKEGAQKKDGRRGTDKREPTAISARGVSGWGGGGGGRKKRHSGSPFSPLHELYSRETQLRTTVLKVLMLCKA